MKLHMYPPRKAEKGHSSYPPRTLLSLPRSILFREVIAVVGGWKGNILCLCLEHRHPDMYVVLSHIS